MYTPYSWVFFLRYVNSTNFADIGRKIAPNIYYLGRPFVKINREKAENQAFTGI